MLEFFTKLVLKYFIPVELLSLYCMSRCISTKFNLKQCMTLSGTSVASSYFTFFHLLQKHLKLHNDERVMYTRIKRTYDEASNRKNVGILMRRFKPMIENSHSKNRTF